MTLSNLKPERYLNAVSSMLTSSRKLIEKISLVAQLLNDSTGLVFACGNGGSAAIASHLCVDLLKFADIPATSIGDQNAIMTMVGNDFGYESVFSWWLNRIGEPEDILVCLSTSGTSANIVAAARCAKSLKMQVISICGYSESQRELETLSDKLLVIDSSDVMLIEDLQHIICHSIAREAARLKGRKN